MSRRITLWHPDSPGMTVEADVAFPRWLWVKRPDRETGTPRSIATLGETVRANKRRTQERRDRADAECRALIANAPPVEARLIEHADYLGALSNAMEGYAMDADFYDRRHQTLSIPTFVHAAYTQGVRNAQRARQGEGR